MSRPTFEFDGRCSGNVIGGTCIHSIENNNVTEYNDASQYLFFVKTIILAAAAVFFGCLHRKWSWRNHPFYHDPGSPPVVPYYLPFLGSTIAFWKDMIGFLTFWSKKFDSDIFSAYMGGRPFIFVLDPLAAGHLVGGRISSLSWVEAKYRMMKNGLGGSHKSARAWITQANLKEEHAIVERHMMNEDYLNITLKKYQIALDNDIVPNLMKCSHEGEWTKGNILEIVGKAIFYATIESVFGYRSLKNSEDYETTMLFERKFPIFTGMNSQLMQKFDRKRYAARENHVKKLKDIFQNLLSPDYQPVDDKSDFFGDLIKEYGQFAHDKMNLDDIARFHYLFFVASYFNTIPACFWAVFHMLQNPNAYEACRKEIVFAKEDLKKKDGDYFTLSDLDKMDVLESLIQESMRLRSTTKMIRLRYANEDFRLKLPLPVTGITKEFNVRKGTYFVSCPTLMHRDPEIFKDPLTFKYDRFARDPNTGKSPIFFKNGKRLHRPVDAFGGGLTMCPGRRFAVTEIKALIVSILLNYELRWPDDGDAPDPPIDNKGIVNTGMPVNDVKFEFRKVK